MITKSYKTWMSALGEKHRVARIVKDGWKLMRNEEEKAKALHAQRKVKIRGYRLSKEDQSRLDKVMNEWVQTEVIEETTKEKIKFIVPHFVLVKEQEVPDMPVKVRAISDCREVNELLYVNTFKLFQLKDLDKVIRPNDWLFKLDAKSAYNAIDIAEEDRELLGLKFKNKYYRFKSLCFGLNQAPFAYTMIMTTFINYIRSTYDISCVSYIDDVLAAGDRASIVDKRKILDNEFYKFGFRSSNKPGSTPSRSVEFLGFIIDMDKGESGLIYVPERKLRAIEEMLSLVRRDSMLSVGFFLATEWKVGVIENRIAIVVISSQVYLWYFKRESYNKIYQKRSGFEEEIEGDFSPARRSTVVVDSFKRAQWRANIPFNIYIDTDNRCFTNCSRCFCNKIEPEVDLRSSVLSLCIKTIISSYAWCTLFSLYVGTIVLGLRDNELVGNKDNSDSFEILCGEKGDYGYGEDLYLVRQQNSHFSLSKLERKQSDKTTGRSDSDVSVYDDQEVEIGPFRMDGYQDECSCRLCITCIQRNRLRDFSGAGYSRWCGEEVGLQYGSSVGLNVEPIEQQVKALYGVRSTTFIYSFILIETTGDMDISSTQFSRLHIDYNTAPLELAIATQTDAGRQMDTVDAPSIDNSILAFFHPEREEIVLRIGESIIYNPFAVDGTGVYSRRLHGGDGQVSGSQMGRLMFQPQVTFRLMSYELSTRESYKDKLIRYMKNVNRRRGSRRWFGLDLTTIDSGRAYFMLESALLYGGESISFQNGQEVLSMVSECKLLQPALTTVVSAAAMVVQSWDSRSAYTKMHVGVTKFQRSLSNFDRISVTRRQAKPFLVSFLQVYLVAVLKNKSVNSRVSDLFGYTDMRLKEALSYLSFDELRDYAVGCTSLLCLLRPSELQLIQWKNVTFTDGFVHILVYRVKRQSQQLVQYTQKFSFRRSSCFYCLCTILETYVSAVRVLCRGVDIPDILPYERFFGSSALLPEIPGTSIRRIGTLKIAYLDGIGSILIHLRSTYWIDSGSVTELVIRLVSPSMTFGATGRGREWFLSRPEAERLVEPVPVLDTTYKGWSSYSFRVGGAVHAYSVNGLTLDQIRRKGDWSAKSNVVVNYLSAMIAGNLSN